MVQRQRPENRLSLSHKLWQENFAYLSTDKQEVSRIVELLREKFLHFSHNKDYENNKDIIDVRIVWDKDHNYFYGLRTKPKYCGRGNLPVEEVHSEFFHLVSSLTLYKLVKGDVIPMDSSPLSDFLIRKPQIIYGTIGELDNIIRNIKNIPNHPHTIFM